MRPPPLPTGILRHCDRHNLASPAVPGHPLSSPEPEPPMDPASLALFALALVVAAGAPGPSIAALVARVISRGTRDGLAVPGGDVAGRGAVARPGGLGPRGAGRRLCAACSPRSEMGRRRLSRCGWPGRCGARRWPRPATLPERASPLRMFAAGLAVTLGNPKIMLFYMALLPSLVDLDRLGLAGWGELTLAMLAVLIACRLHLGGAGRAGAAVARQPAGTPHRQPRLGRVDGRRRHRHRGALKPDRVAAPGFRIAGAIRPAGGLPPPRTPREYFWKNEPADAGGRGSGQSILSGPSHRMDRRRSAG